jgi:hypothetical protein
MIKIIFVKVNPKILKTKLKSSQLLLASDFSTSGIINTPTIYLNSS